MRRRNFLRSAAVVGTGVVVSGCLGGDGQQAPPRKAEVFDGLRIEGESLQINFYPNPWVESRVDLDGRLATALGVGVASAGGRGGRGGSGSGSKGASGRGRRGHRDAPKNGRGWAVYGGTGSRHRWRDDHDDDLETYQCDVARCGVAYLGSESSFGDNPPGPGPVNWDRTWSNPNEEATYTVDKEGWYRTGAKVVHSRSGHDFGWESVDFLADSTGSGYEMDNPWKVSPRA